jgi:hypothetical protein
MTPNQQRVIALLSNTKIIFAVPNGTVERITVYGVHGDLDDFAASLSWRTADGDEWESDFTEQSLNNAVFEKNLVTLVDTMEQQVTFSAHELKPVHV